MCKTSTAMFTNKIECLQLYLQKQDRVKTFGRKNKLAKRQQQQKREKFPV